MNKQCFTIFQFNLYIALHDIHRQQLDSVATAVRLLTHAVSGAALTTRNPRHKRIFVDLYYMPMFRTICPQIKVRSDQTSKTTLKK